MHAIHRFVYRAQAKPGQEAAAVAAFQAQANALTPGLQAGDLMTLGVFRLGPHFFAYWERIATPHAPDALFGAVDAYLLPWPGRDTLRTFVPMTDIFHWQSPGGVEHWRRKVTPERISGRLARLKPEMASSYIFYHYQLQEERPGSVDKAGLIALHENLIFFYQEHPAVVEPPAVPGKLHTANTPDHWQDVMFPHFDLWDDTADGETIWRSLELVCHRHA